VEEPPHFAFAVAVAVAVALALAVAAAVLALLFSCHPSPKAEDLLLPCFCSCFFAFCSVVALASRYAKPSGLALYAREQRGFSPWVCAQPFPQ